jgi:MtN3 and saliva related transmembrane protein
MIVEYLKNFIEVMFALSMFINAALFVPQAVKIYKTKYVKGISKVTFLGFNIIQIFTILHAYINCDYILMFGFILAFLASGIVTFLVFSYK